MDPASHKELVDKQIKPANTPKLVAPRCNSEIWRIISSSTRQRDEHIQQTQTKLVTGLVPLVYAMEKNIDLTIDTLLKDSFQLLAQAHMDLNNERK